MKAVVGAFWAPERYIGCESASNRPARLGSKWLYQQQNYQSSDDLIGVQT
jgi:hypothetical protein